MSPLLRLATVVVRVVDDQNGRVFDGTYRALLFLVSKAVRTQSREDRDEPHGGEKITRDEESIPGMGRGENGMPAFLEAMAKPIVVAYIASKGLDMEGSPDAETNRVLIKPR